MPQDRSALEDRTLLGSEGELDVRGLPTGRVEGIVASEGHIALRVEVEIRAGAEPLELVLTER